MADTVSSKQEAKSAHGDRAERKPIPEKKKSGIERAATLMIALGSEAAAEITRYLSDNELEDISAEIVALGAITSIEKDVVIEEFYQTTMARDFISQGGEEYAREMLIGSLGERKAKAIMSRFRGMGESNYFGLISNVNAESIANFLKKEHPQTIALVLSTLPREQAGKILAAMPEDMRATISYRMATIERPSTEVISEIQAVLGDYVMTDFQDMGESFGGTTHVAETFNEIEQSVWKPVLEEIEEIDPDLAQAIKSQMFTFTDLVLLDNNSVQSVLKEVDSKDLGLALKGASEEVKSLIYENMSKRAMKAIKEEMEYMGAVRVTDVEAAQSRIIEVVRAQESEGLIFIEGRGGTKGGGYIE